MDNSVSIDDVLDLVNTELAQICKNRAYAQHNAHVARDNKSEYVQGFSDGKAEAFKICARKLAKIMEQIELIQEG